MNRRHQRLSLSRVSPFKSKQFKSTQLNSTQHKSNQIKSNVSFLRRGEDRSTRRKTSRSRVENQQTQPTYDAESGNRTRATLVEGECSHHCAHNPAPRPSPKIFGLQMSGVNTLPTISPPQNKLTCSFAIESMDC